jgi:hypothetical protein
MNEENITCDFCNKKKWAFVDVDTEKSLFSKRFRVCVDCFKNKDIEELVGIAMEKDANQNIAHHQKQIDEIKVRLQKSK